MREMTVARWVDERTVLHDQNANRTGQNFARRITQSIPSVTGSGNTRDYLLATSLGGSGNIRRFSGRRQIASAPGLGRITISGPEHEDSWLIPEPTEALHVYVARSTLRNVLLEEADTDASDLAIEPTWGRDDKVLSGLMSVSLHACASPSGGDALLIESLETAIATRLLCEYSSAASRLGRRAPDRKGSEDARVIRAKDFVEAHLGESLKIARIAEAACLSSSRLQQHFRLSTGMTVHAYVIERRCVRARALVSNGHLPLVQVAERCGFSSHSHMTHAFGRRYGVTPAKMRAAVRSR